MADGSSLAGAEPFWLALTSLGSDPDAAKTTALRSLAAAVRFDSRNCSPVLCTTLATSVLASRPRVAAQLSSGISCSTSTWSAPAETFVEGVALLRQLLQGVLDQHAHKGGFLHAPPAVIGALLECLSAPLRGLLSETTLHSSDGRIKPLCDALKAIFELLPDPKRTDATPLPQEPQLVPLLESLCRALLEACAAEHQRAEDNFTLMNATWRLLVRLGSTLPRLPRPEAAAHAAASAPPLCVPLALLQGLLPPLCSAFDALNVGSQASTSFLSHKT